MDHAVGDQANVCRGAPDAVTFAALAARHAPINARLASPIWPVRALLEGKSVAPAKMINALTPRQPSQGKAFMDDRNIKSQTLGQLRSDLEHAANCDAEVRFKENQKKSQMRTRAD